jgi:Fe-Mn family superoxide dismutase
MLEIKTFDSIKQLDGISEKTMVEHYKLYSGYVKKFNEIEDALQTVDRQAANQIYSQMRAVKVEQTFALGGVKNHEKYFEILGGFGSKPSAQAEEIITREYQTVDNFKRELTAVAMASRGWAFVSYDYDLKRLLITPGDSQNTYLIWNAELIIALDIYEHAYFQDYGVDRLSYIEAFYRNLNWEKINKSLKTIN